MVVEFIETTAFSVAVISTGSMTTAIYTFGTTAFYFIDKLLSCLEMIFPDFFRWKNHPLPLCTFSDTILPKQKTFSDDRIDTVYVFPEETFILKALYRIIIILYAISVPSTHF